MLRPPPGTFAPAHRPSRHGACAPCPRAVQPTLLAQPRGAVRMRTAPLLPPPTLPHPPGRSPDDVEGIPGLLSGPRPGGAPGDLRHRCQPGLRGRAGKDADPQSGAEVRGGEG